MTECTFWWLKVLFHNWRYYSITEGNTQQLKVLFNNWRYYAVTKGTICSEKSPLFSSVISLFLPYALESCRLSKILACEIQVIFFALLCMYGSYRFWKTRNILEIRNCPGKSLNFFSSKLPSSRLSVCCILHKYISLEKRTMSMQKMDTKANLCLWGVLSDWAL